MLVTMEEPHGLEPPERKDVADPGAHQLAEASDSEDQFMDAQSLPSSSTRGSLSLEENRDEQTNARDSSKETSASGSDSCDPKESDGEHDAIAVPQDNESNATTPKPDDGVFVPLTVLKESSGEHPGQHLPDTQQHYEMDASPDVVLGPDDAAKDASIAQTLDVPADTTPDNRLPAEEAVETVPVTDAEEPDAADEDVPEDNFDDDFDDFEEGDGQDEDFDDFEDGFQEPETHTAPPPAMPAVPTPQPNLLPFSIPDLDGLSPDEVISSIDPCISNLFPPEDHDFPIFPELAQDPVFLTTRSASLWSQLVAPPPLAPPDWIRSHTRRLFLVSLGVPVDLDEILPASKQKKLILPSTSPRHCIDRRPSTTGAGRAEGSSGAAAAAAATASATASSADGQAKDQSSSSRKRKGPPPEPELDLVAAKHLCHTTDEALGGMALQELQDHVAKLEAMQGVAGELLEYWTKRTEEKIGDKEAFEGVIENLVAHARKVRK